MKIKRAISKKPLIASVATVVVLASGGVSYGIMQQRDSVSNAEPTPSVSVSPSPSATPIAELENVPVPTASTTPKPTSTPTPTPQGLTYDEIYIHTLKRLNANWSSYGFGTGMSITQLANTIAQNSKTKPHLFKDNIDATIDQCVNFYKSMDQRLVSTNFAKKECGF